MTQKRLDTPSHSDERFHSSTRKKYRFWCSFVEIKINLEPKKSNTLYLSMHQYSFCSATVVCTGHTLNETQLLKFRHSAVQMSRVART